MEQRQDCYTKNNNLKEEVEMEYSDNIKFYGVPVETGIENVKPMPKEDPRPRRTRAGQRGGSTAATIARRAQLQQNPGEWFVWKDNAKTGGDTGQALRTLVGNYSLKGVDRKTLPYESTARINENGTWTVYVRYVGQNREFAE